MRRNGRVLAAAALAVMIPCAGWPPPLPAQPTAALPPAAPNGTAGVAMPGLPPQGTASLGTVVHAESGKPVARARPAGSSSLAVTRTVSR